MSPLQEKIPHAKIGFGYLGKRSQVTDEMQAITRVCAAAFILLCTYYINWGAGCPGTSWDREL